MIRDVIACAGFLAVKSKERPMIRPSPVQGQHVQYSALWKAEAVESFDFQDFNVGNYYGAVDEKVVSETITKVLYPNDEPEVGKRLRLAQQYFFVSCSLQDMLRIHGLMGGSRRRFMRRPPSNSMTRIPPSPWPN